jgi:hypothetical protein
MGLTGDCASRRRKRRAGFPSTYGFTNYQIGGQR